MKLPAKVIIPATLILIAGGAVTGYMLYQQNTTGLTPAFTDFRNLFRKPIASVAAGTPLPPTSTSQIAVLPGQDGLAGTPITDSDHPLPSTTSIILPEPEPEVSATSAPVVFDPTAARLGTTLSLLVNAWPNGGILPRQLAAAAAELASQSNQPALARAANSLRSATPRQGPVTLQVLLLETSSVVTLTPPEDLPQTDAQAEAEKSWFRKQLESLIHISSTPATQNRWVTAILTVQQQLVRGAVNDASATLSASPLENDPRLEPLRSLVHDYLSQSGKLTNLVTLYTSTYLTVKDTE